MADETPYNESGLLSLFSLRPVSTRAIRWNLPAVWLGASPEVDFDLWRQFTIEHLIGEGQVGYPPRIKVAVDARLGISPTPKDETSP